MESLPHGAANTDLDNESGIGDDSAVGSEHEDIDDTPTSVRRVCSHKTILYVVLELSIKIIIQLHAYVLQVCTYVSMSSQILLLQA